MDHIAVQARLQPNRPALEELLSGRKWDYNALDHAVSCCASVLRSCNLSHGQRVTIVARNCAELIVLHWACARIGVIYVPLNWRLTVAELDSLIKDSDPSLLIGDDLLDPISSDVPRLSVTELTIEIDKAEPLPYQKTNKDDISLILYTSGTSGKPKGVLLSEHNLYQTALNFSILGRVTSQSVFLNDSPMFHIIGLITNVRPTFLQGASLLISEGFDAKRTLARMANPKLQVTHYFGVPQMAAMLRQEETFDPKQLQNMTGIFTGGAPHPKADIMAWVKDGIPIIDGFGMSEAGTVFGMPIELKMIEEKAGSVGIPTSNIDACIMGANGQICANGQAGELLLKGENITKEYWRQPEASADSFTKDGWFLTGDVAICDEDGFYYLVDRKKDMYISGGENVYPAEVEAALAGLENIIEAAIVGVPDEKWGEVGHLVIVCKKGSSLDMEHVLKYLEPKIARYKLPKHLSILDKIPRTGSGKVQKNKLRELLCT